MCSFAIAGPEGFPVPWAVDGCSGHFGKERLFLGLGRFHCGADSGPDLPVPRDGVAHDWDRHRLCRLPPRGSLLVILPNQKGNLCPSHAVVQWGTRGRLRRTGRRPGRGLAVPALGDSKRPKTAAESKSQSSETSPTTTTTTCSASLI